MTKATNFIKPLHQLMIGLFLCLLVPSAHAQESFQLLSLEQELLFQLDQYRESNNLPPLQRSEVLDAVAFDQAEYIAEKGRLVHDQDKDEKETLMDRILYFEALYAEAGENIAMISPNSREEIDEKSGRVEISSEELLIKAAIYSWKDEEESLLNLNDPNFYEIGIGVHETERKEFVIVAVFASKPYELNGIKQKFNFRGIDPYKEENCREFADQFGTAPELFSDAFVLENGELFFEYHNKKVVDKVLSFGKSAITAEVLTDDQFVCGESNRLFPGEITDGYLLPLLKKGAMMTMDEEEKKEDGIKLSIGEVPAELLQGGYEINGIIVQNGSKCATIPYNRLAVKNLRWLDLPFKLVDPIKDSIAKQDTLEFALPLNNTEALKKEVAEMNSLLSNIDFKISSLSLTKAISPIAENVSADQALQDLSASLANAELVNGTGVKVERQWEEYREFEKNTIYWLESGELDSIAKLNYLRETAKTDEDLRNFMNSLNQLKVELYGNISIKKELSSEERLELFHFLRRKGKMEMATKLLNQMIADKDQSLAEVLSARERLDQNEEDLPLINNLMVAAIEDGEVTFDGNPMATAFLEIHLIDQSQKTIRYNYLIATLKSWAERSSKVNRIDEWESSFEKLRAFLEPKLYAKVMLNFRMIMADHYYDLNKSKEREEAFKEMMKLLPKAKLSAEEHYEIAQYLAYQDQSSRGLEALMPVVKAEEVELEHLFYFLQLAIYDNELVPDKLFLQILDKTEAAYPDQYCKLFSKERMGLQLLKDYAIKERYCNRCEE